MNLGPKVLDSTLWKLWCHRTMRKRRACHQHRVIRHKAPSGTAGAREHVAPEDDESIAAKCD